MSRGSPVAITAPPARSATATTNASTASSEPALMRPSSCPARTPTRVSTGCTRTRSRRMPAKTAASAARPRTTSARTAATIPTGSSRRRISMISARMRSRRRAGPCAIADMASLSRRSISRHGAPHARMRPLRLPALHDVRGPVQRLRRHRAMIAFEFDEPVVDGREMLQRVDVRPQRGVHRRRQASRSHEGPQLLQSGGVECQRDLLLRHKTIVVLSYLVRGCA